MTEVTAADAPVWLGPDEAEAWAQGYNTAMERGCPDYPVIPARNEATTERVSSAASAQYGWACPRCAVAPYAPCRAASGRVTDTHAARLTPPARETP